MGPSRSLYTRATSFVDWGWEEVLDLEDPNALILPTWSIMFDISGAYEKMSKTCNCGEKNGCQNRNCSCSGTRCLPTCKRRGECRKDSKDQAGASEVVDQEVEGSESDESD